MHFIIYSVAYSGAVRTRSLLVACDLLGGTGAALTIDLAEFHRQLYGMLGPHVADASGDPEAK